MSRLVRLGRTAQELPREWLGLRPGDKVVEGRPFWVEGSPARWQGALRDSWIAARLGEWLELCGDEESAHRTLTADLVALLSGFGKGKIDLAVLSPRRALEPFQLEGAVRALEDARTEGLVGATGLASAGGSLSVLANWRFADAFDAVAFQGGIPEEARAVASERRSSLVVIEDGEADFLVRFARSGP
ncbi:MAG: hypothetical protein AB7F50_01765 [Fimbriimonadaceae bacterium]